MKNKKFINIILLLLIISLLFSISCKKTISKKITIKGSTTVLPLVLKTAEDFKALNKNEIKFSISGTGSGDGIKALLDGNCDIATSSRALSKEELDTAFYKQIKLHEIVIAYDMLVPIVHPSNPVNSCTIEQLTDIYKGKIRNWKMIGGKDTNIVVVSRTSSSGTYSIWNKKIIQKNEVVMQSINVASNGAVVSAVAENHKAIGYIGMGYINEKIKPVKINNIPATVNNGKTGKYPVSRKLYLIVDENNLSNESNAFIDYILSETGQKSVSEAGFITL